MESELIRVLVYGFFHKGNIGDQLFIEAFRSLFPNYYFTFTSHIQESDLLGMDALFLGGGSFLDKDPNICELPPSLPLFYIGVGTETQISPRHQELLARAQVVAIRSPASLLKVQKINPVAFVIPDIVHALSQPLTLLPNSKSCLFIPNAEVLSQNQDPQWKFTAWDYARSELSQFLDDLVNEGWNLHFVSFCHNPKMSDVWAGDQIISLMQHRSTQRYQSPPQTFSELHSLFSQYNRIISQRYHGLVLSEITQRPCLNLFHHDKLQYIHPFSGISQSFFGLNKASLHQAFKKMEEVTFSPAQSSPFAELLYSVKKGLDKEDE